jgi:hypothetical protein
MVVVAEIVALSVEIFGCGAIAAEPNSSADKRDLDSSNLRRNLFRRVMTPQRYSLFFYGTLMAPAVLYRVIYGLRGAPESSNLIIRAAILQV